VHVKIASERLEKIARGERLPGDYDPLATYPANWPPPGWQD
jgi:hypothetical protein